MWLLKKKEELENVKYSISQIRSFGGYRRSKCYPVVVYGENHVNEVIHCLRGFSTFSALKDY